MRHRGPTPRSGLWRPSPASSAAAAAASRPALGRLRRVDRLGESGERAIGEPAELHAEIRGRIGDCIERAIGRHDLDAITRLGATEPDAGRRRRSTDRSNP